MAYGILKCDNITFDNGGSDQNVTVSGLYRATTSGVTVSGTIAAGTVSGVTVIGSTTVSGDTVTGTTANFTSGNFSNLISAAATMSGALIMANQQQVRFREAVGNGVNHIALQAPAIVSADQTITLPDETGTLVTTGDNGSVTSTMLATNLTISAAAGSAAAPSIAFTGDLNTGIYSPGADQLAVATNGDQRVSIDSSGRLLVGTSTARTNFGASGTPSIQYEGTTASGSQIGIVRSENGPNGSAIILGKTRATSVGGTTVVNSGDNLGFLIFEGADGTNLVRAAQITAEVDGTPGGGIVPGRIVFDTANSSGTLTECARITSTGAVLVGATAAPTDVADGDIALQNRLVMNASAANYGQFQRIADVGTNITSTTGTIVFKFKSALINSNRSAFVKINLSGRSNNATPSNSPACEYAFQLHQTSAGVCTINGTTTIFEYTFVRATHFAFANLGSGECTVTLTNPTGQSITPAYMVEINTQAGVFGLDTVTIT
jgi:hypothetical protein